jgi:hypothetical protein
MFKLTIIGVLNIMLFTMKQKKYGFKQLNEPKRVQWMKLGQKPWFANFPKKRSQIVDNHNKV